MNGLTLRAAHKFVFIICFLGGVFPLNQSHAQYSYDPSLDLLQFFGQSCPFTKGEATDVALGQNASLTAIVESMQRDPECVGLANRIIDYKEFNVEALISPKEEELRYNRILEESNNLSKAYIDEYNRIQVSKRKELALSTMAEEAEAEGEEFIIEPFPSISKFPPSETYLKSIEVKLNQRRLDSEIDKDLHVYLKERNRYQSVRALYQTTDSLMDEITRNINCLSHSPNLLGQIGGQLASASSFYFGGTTGALLLAGGNIMDKFFKLAKTWKDSKHRKRLQATTYNIGLNCAIESITKNYCEAWDNSRILYFMGSYMPGSRLEAQRARLQRQIDYLEQQGGDTARLEALKEDLNKQQTQDELLNNVRVASRDLPAFFKWINRIQAGSPATTDAIAEEKKTANGLVEQLQNFESDLSAASAEADIREDYELNYLTKLTGLFGRNIRSGNGSNIVEGPLYNVFIRDTSCGPQTFLYTFGSRTQDNYLFECAGRVNGQRCEDCIRNLLNIPVTDPLPVPSKSTLDSAAQVILALAQNEVKEEVAIIRDNNPLAVLLLAHTKSVGFRSPIEFIDSSIDMLNGLLGSGNYNTAIEFENIESVLMRLMQTKVILDKFVEITTKASKQVSRDQIDRLNKVLVVKENLFNKGLVEKKLLLEVLGFDLLSDGGGGEAPVQKRKTINPVSTDPIDAPFLQASKLVQELQAVLAPRSDVFFFERHFKLLLEHYVNTEIESGRLEPMLAYSLRLSKVGPLSKLLDEMTGIDSRISTLENARKVGHSNLESVGDVFLKPLKQQLYRLYSDYTKAYRNNQKSNGAARSQLQLAHRLLSQTCLRYLALPDRIVQSLGLSMYCGGMRYDSLHSHSEISMEFDKAVNYSQDHRSCVFFDFNRRSLIWEQQIGGTSFTGNSPYSTGGRQMLPDTFGQDTAPKTRFNYTKLFPFPLPNFDLEKQADNALVEEDLIPEEAAVEPLPEKQEPGFLKKLFSWGGSSSEESVDEPEDNSNSSLFSSPSQSKRKGPRGRR